MRDICFVQSQGISYSCFAHAVLDLTMLKDDLNMAIET